MRNTKKPKYHPYYDLTAGEIARITGASPRTALNWCNGQPMHPAYKRLLELHIDHKVLPDDSRLFIDGEAIWCDGLGGENISFLEIHSYWLTRQRLDGLQVKNRLLQRDNDRLRSEAQKRASEDTQAPSQMIVENPLAAPEAANEAI